MTAATLDAMSPLERTIVERALTMAWALEFASCSSPNRQGGDRCETHLLAYEREFFCRSLEEVPRDRVEVLK